MTWRNYPASTKPRPKHREPADKTARQQAIEDALDLRVKDEIKRQAKEAALDIMARFERDRGKR